MGADRINSGVSLFFLLDVEIFFLDFFLCFFLFVSLIT